MVTLHAYVLRELLKVFVLTLIALSALFTMGGGLYNIIRHEGVTAAGVFKGLPLLLPVVLTATMPLAALFSAAMVYGRLAADNEFTACRAAGINVHRLFLPCGLLALLVTLFSIYAANYWIPDSLRHLDHFVRSNVRDFVFEQLRLKGYVRRPADKSGSGNNTILTAESVQSVPDEVLREKDFEVAPSNLSYFWINAPTIIVDESDSLRQFATATGGLCQFDTRSENVQFTLYLQDADYYEMGKRSTHFDKQTFGPVELPIPLPLKTYMVDLNTLLAWRKRPWEAADLKPDVREFHRHVRHAYFTQECLRQLQAGQAVQLRDRDGSHFELSGASAEIDERKVLVRSARVVERRRDGRPSSRYTAPEARLWAQDDGAGGDFVHIRLRTVDKPVVEVSGGTGERETRREREELFLGPLLIPEATLAPVKALDPPTLLDVEKPLPVSSPELDDKRHSLERTVARFERKADSTLHFRFALASSSLLTVLMGAILGTIYRGARALAAFGLACVPLFSVLILMLMGKQLAENAGTTDVGLGIMWSGLALVGVGDVLLLWLGVRR